MIHTRDAHSLSDDGLDIFTQDMDEFMADDRSGPNRPDHLVADLAAKGTVFREKIDLMNTALADRKTASKKIKDSVEAMEELVRWMRNILPTLSDESILLPFGLDNDIPTDYAGIKNYADTVNTHWQTVSGDALFEPVEDRMDELEPLLTIYDDARADQIAADGQYDQAQNEKDIARAKYLEVERTAFSWYLAYYPDAQDIYWEQTPWGKYYGEEEPGEPEPPENWDDAPTGFTVTKSPLGDSIDINCGVHPDADGINVYLSEGEYGDDTAPPRASSPKWAGAPMPLQVDVAYNVRHWLWVCAVKDGVEGAFAGPLWIEFTESVTPIVPV